MNLLYEHTSKLREQDKLQEKSNNGININQSLPISNREDQTPVKADSRPSSYHCTHNNKSTNSSKDSLPIVPVLNPTRQHPKLPTQQLITKYTPTDCFRNKLDSDDKTPPAETAELRELPYNYPTSEAGGIGPFGPVGSSIETDLKMAVPDYYLRKWTTVFEKVRENNREKAAREHGEIVRGHDKAAGEHNMTAKGQEDAAKEHEEPPNPPSRRTTIENEIAVEGTRNEDFSTTSEEIEGEGTTGEKKEMRLLT